MLSSWSIVAPAAVLVITYFLITRLTRRRIGPQPGFFGLLFAATAACCILVTFHALQRFGIDVMDGQPRDVFWLILGLLWLLLAARSVRQRLSSGVVLVDLGPAPMFKLQIACAVLLFVVAIRLTTDSESYVQAFAYSTWAAWFLVMARGRFSVRERGVIAGELLPWNRITGCVVVGDDMVHMHLNRRFRRTVALKIPPERLNPLIEFVNQLKGANPDRHKL